MQTAALSSQAADIFAVLPPLVWHGEATGAPSHKHRHRWEAGQQVQQHRQAFSGIAYVGSANPNKV